MKWLYVLLCSFPLWLCAQEDVKNDYIYYNEGVRAHNKGDYVNAIKCYEKCLVVNPQHKLARQNMGSVYYNQSIDAYNSSDYNSSIKFAQSALKYAPKSADAYALLGNNHQKLRDYQTAIVDFSEAIKVSENPAVYYAARSWVYNDLLDNVNRLADMEMAAELEPDNATYQFYAGKYKQSLGEERFKLAIDNYNKAIELDPEYREAYIERGAYYMTFGQFEKALADLRKAEALGADVSHLVEAAEYELKMQEEEKD